MPKKKTYYFQHDCNAREDEKIVALRIDHGSAGYGLYFMLLEVLALSDNCAYDRNYRKLAFILREDEAFIQKVVENYKLFEFSDDGTQFFSARLREHMKSMNDISETNSNNARRGGGNPNFKKGQPNPYITKKIDNSDNSVILDDNRPFIDEINHNRREYNKIKYNIIKENIREEESINARTRENAPFEVDVPKNGTDYLPDEQEEERLHEIILQGIVNFYESIGRNYIPDFRAETTAAVELSSKIRVAMKTENWLIDPDNLTTFWQNFLGRAWSVADQWQRDNFNIKIINSQFNNLYNKIKNGNSSGNNGISRDYIERKMREAAGAL